MSDILQTAQDAVKERGKDYGDVYVNHKRIADQWAVTLGVPVEPEQVAIMMVQLKLARLMETPAHEDSWIDVAGYAWTGSNCIKGT